MQGDLQKILQTPWDKPFFFTQVFLHEITQSKEELVSILDLKEEALLSFACDASFVQDSVSLRIQRRSLLLAEYLLNETGELVQERLSHVIFLLEKGGYIPCPGGFSDGVLTSHILSILRKLRDDASLYGHIQKFKEPLCSKFAEDLVRDSLGLNKSVHLSNRDVRVAVLSACLTSLRQNVGSCFATAPAILIQQGQIEGFLIDLYELLTTGKLKRVSQGIESIVPLSPTFGAGDLNRRVDVGKQSPLFFKGPGLIRAFASIGFIEDGEDLEGLLSFLKEEGDLTIGEIIHKVLLHKLGITEDDIIAHRKMAKSLAQTQGAQGSFSAHLSTSQMYAVEEMLEKSRKAKASFKSLTDHPLLKAWEFTIASFAEVKMEFSRWNLYSSLGLHQDEEGGIGEVIYRALETKLSASNEKIEEYHEEYIVAHEQLRASEALLKRASTESEIRRLKGEFDSRLYHMRSCQDRRDDAQKEASLIASFLPELMEKYNEKFQEYFQEIYDAEMHDVKLGQYEDSPAGFRLVYKHGRSDASLWDRIYTAEEYIEALSHFFNAVESQIAAELDEKLKKTLGDITTAVLIHIQERRFLETAVARMMKAHGEKALKNPLEALDKMEKKPWAYTSGGSMDTLLKMYYRHEGEVTEEGRWVDSATDLFTLVVDTLRGLPLSVEKQIEEGKSLLMTSATHAFILCPNFFFLKQGWQSKTFTYSWVRDNIILPRKEFYSSMRLSLSEQSFLLEELLKRLPQGLEDRMKKAVSLDQVTVKAFRDLLFDAVREVYHHAEEKIDSFLYESLPLVERANGKREIAKLLFECDSSKVRDVLENLQEPASPFITAKTIREGATACYLLCSSSPFFSFDLHKHLAEKAAEKRLAPPLPAVFADTNWTSNYFGFVVGPGSLELELWRLDPSGCQGVPMTPWNRYLDGTDRKPWKIYSRPFEYTL